MPRKPTITRMAPEARAYVERLLREDRLTLDEMITELSAKFSSPPPSRSALHRYKESFAAVVEKIRAQETAARAIVADLGENPDDKAGQMLVQTVTAVANSVAARLSATDDEAALKDVAQLARLVKNVTEARRITLRERREIAADAREKVLREQREKLDNLGKTGAVDKAVLDAVIKAAYDL